MKLGVMGAGLASMGWDKALDYCKKVGLEAIELPTRTGDVTLHLSCTQHMSQPPKRRTRKVLYTDFGLEPRDAEAAQRNRLRLDAVRGKTHTRVSQEPGHLGE
ncbi:MAG: hypothetical protein IIA27_09800 [Gemmatimonadetes bacterium]|nr:hypothetical protein [Gemmatimonadota bacterium]